MAAATADAPLHARPFTHDPSAPQPAHQTPINDLLNYDPTAETSSPPPANLPRSSNNPNSNNNETQNANSGLGIDTAIKIRKARKPTAKLDETRLLSDKGIPKLRRITKDRFRFRGKGHEFSDVAKLLGMYQLWLDDLFPKAKFADGIAMVEKLGHTKRMKVMRREWLDEGKPKRQDTPMNEEEDDGFVVGDGRDAEGEREFRPGAGNGQENGEDEEGIYGHDREGGDGDVMESVENDNDPSGDELDALLAEDAAGRVDAGGSDVHNKAVEADNFADEEEAMAGMW